MTETILLTGAAGRLGTILRAHLAPQWKLRSADIRPIADPLENEEILRFDLTDRKALQNAMRGCRAVLHFGGIPLEADFDQINSANIDGTFNVYEAARVSGVKRVIFASSHHVTGYVRAHEPTDVEDPVRPDGLYGVSKVFGEALGRLYFDRYGIEHASLRIGMCVAEPFDHRSLGIWLSFSDLCRLVTQCLDVPTLGYAIVHGVSANRRGWLSNAGAAHVGYEPRSDSEAFAEQILAKIPAFDPGDPTQAYTGGYFTTEKPPRWEGVDMVFVPSKYNGSD